MAQNALVTVTESWANVLSTGTTTNCGFQVKHDGPVEVRGGTSSAPAASDTGLTYELGQGELVGLLTRFAPAATHLYMRKIPLTGGGTATARVQVIDDAV